MSDIEKFKKLYKSFGIICNEIEEKGNRCIRLSKDGDCEEGDTVSEKLDGYSGFLSEILFDKNGKFISQGFWE